MHIVPTCMYDTVVQIMSGVNRYELSPASLLAATPLAVAPHPRLQFFNKDAKVWMPKPLLRAARREHMGHYRRVNQHVWSLWTGTYLGSGPALWVVRKSRPFPLSCRVEENAVRWGGLVEWVDSLALW